MPRWSCRSAWEELLRHDECFCPVFSLCRSGSSSSFCLAPWSEEQVFIQLCGKCLGLVAAEPDLVSAGCSQN